MPRQQQNAQPCNDMPADIGPRIAQKDMAAREVENDEPGHGSGDHPGQTAHHRITHRYGDRRDTKGEGDQIAARQPVQPIDQIAGMGKTGPGQHGEQNAKGRDRQHRLQIGHGRRADHLTGQGDHHQAAQKGGRHPGPRACAKAQVLAQPGDQQQQA